MGLTFTKLFARLFSKKEMRILMVREGGVERESGGLQGRVRLFRTRRRGHQERESARLSPPLCV
jgi:hypothetical protein